MFRSFVLLGIAALLWGACSSSEDETNGAGTGGSSASGGSATGGAGAGGAGGPSGGTGGAGGQSATGGAGGQSATGGTGAAGDTGGAGGTAGTGATGGTAGTGGTDGTAGQGGVGGTGAVGGTSGTAGQGGTGGAGGQGGVGGTGGSGGSIGEPTAEDAAQWVEDYKAANSGNAGRDWDINAKSPAEIAADPDLQRLIDLCGPDQRPVIPAMAWEYGGGDHQWINPTASALVYCVYIPVSPNSDHWQYDSATDSVTVDIYVKFPDENPCKDETGADQVMACLGDPSNVEILVDTASLDDGAGAGLSLSEASTDVYLLLPDGSRVFMHHDA